MYRWTIVDDKTIFGMTVKMYRDPYVAAKTIVSPYRGLELDHYAYKYLNSEIYMYKILDTNFEQYIEERGDMTRIVDVEIPTVQDVGDLIL